MPEVRPLGPKNIQNQSLNSFFANELRLWFFVTCGRFSVAHREGVSVYGKIMKVQTFMIAGYLVFKSDSIPKVIGILLSLASIGYIVIHFFDILLSQYETVISILNMIFFVPMVAGELGFGIWLLFRGGKIRKNV